ncbi:MAG TPA: GC-type dockerin domain-anchored protein [Phycisphaerales bacterium]|nr:GC-type dockerin domain-anchored protein [Phycisphaerales bacterium]
MKAKNLCTYAGLCAGFASMAVAGDKPELKKLDNAINVQPVRVAQARVENGQFVRTGEWMDYNGGQTQRAVGIVFDCFGDSDSDGFPDDVACAMGSSRWWFGTAYCSGMATNDMQNAATGDGSGYTRSDFAWAWTCSGSGAEWCVIGLWTQESDPRNCEGDSGDYSGWLLDFGTLTCNPGGYYYTNVDLGGGTWPMPTNGDGSYLMAFFQSTGFALATCAQPMLWGTSNNGGDPGRPGTQETEQLDDDAPLDGFHSVPTECYTYSFGVCPDPIGAALSFWGEAEGGGPCDFADCDGNGVVDTRDFTCFFNLFVPRDPAADCDQNGVVDTRDFTCFLNVWNQCR